MDKINSPGATVDREFTEGSPTGGVPATVVSSKWLNDVQRELLAVMSAAGLSPDPAQQNQVITAILYIIQNPPGAARGANYMDFGDAFGNLTLQWGAFGAQLAPGANGIATLPVAFATDFYRVIPFYDFSDVGARATFNAFRLSLTQLRIWNTDTTNGATPSWLAIGR